MVCAIRRRDDAYSRRMWRGAGVANEHLPWSGVERHRCFVNGRWLSGPPRRTPLDAKPIRTTRQTAARSCGRHAWRHTARDRRA